MKKFGKYLVLFLTFEMLTSLMGCKPEVHTHTFADSWTSDAEYHWHEATCEHAEEVSDLAIHTWGYGVVTKQATEEEEGELLFTCYVCKKTKTEVIEKLEHSHKYASDWESDEEYHWHPATCGHTEEVADMASHYLYWDSGVVTKEATEEGDGELLFTCDVCKRTKIVDFCKFSTDWESDENYHWQPAICCGRRENWGEHIWDEGIVTEEPTCVTKGIRIRKCLICEREGLEYIPELYSTPIDAETGEPATSSSTYILFGVFPKTVKAADVTVTYCYDIHYYKGSDGEYYDWVDAPILAAEYKKYSDGSAVESLGEDKYFRVEPIKWKVLTKNYNGTGNALLLAEDIITAVPYYKYNNSSYTRTVGTDKNIYPNNYKYSQIRAYLNNLYYYWDESKTSYSKESEYYLRGFLNTAFTSSARELIAYTVVDNSFGAGSEAAVYACENTNDKIFLLSVKEAANSDYGFSGGKDQARFRYPTDYALASGAQQDEDCDGRCPWGLRTPSSPTRSEWFVRDVTSDGGISICDQTLKYGVVPALTISLE